MSNVYAKDHPGSDPAARGEHCPAQAALAGDHVPFHGSDVGTFDLPGTCSGGSLQVVITGSGIATHLGRYSYQAIECFNPVTGAFSGVPTITAANGDQLFGTCTGQVAPPTTRTLSATRSS